MKWTTLITDCDGVLIDSEVVAHAVLVRETAKVFAQVDVAQYVNDSFGKKMEHLVLLLAKRAGTEVPEAFIEHLRAATDAGIESQADAMADVQRLTRLPQLKAVVSNSAHPRIASALRKVGLDERSDLLVLSGDDVPMPKPAPDIYHLAARTLKVRPEECLVIEDSEAGVLAALAAGMSVIGFVGGAHIPAGHEARLRALGVERVFEHMSLLPDVLRELTDWAIPQE